jgi:hypothetical protein
MSSPASQSNNEDPSVEVTAKHELTERQRQFAESPHLQVLCTWAETSAASLPVESLLSLVDELFDTINDACNESPAKEQFFRHRDTICEKIKEKAVWLKSLKSDPVKLIEYILQPKVQKLDECGKSETDRLIDNVEMFLQALKINKLDPSEREMHIERWKAAQQLRIQEECEEMLRKAAQAQIQAPEEKSKEEVQDNPMPQ